ncbi:MAG TPA: hypothetical protein VLG09_03965 [Candidatus Saccharimonadales bacterium]|nr:hypothetical protein [Candidatus Saccharimonadales bacterium]
MSYGKDKPVREAEPVVKSNTRRYVIAFNGPPRAGKDTASSAVCAVIRDRANWLQVRHMKLSEPLKKGCHALFSAFHSPDYYDLPENSQQKDLPSGDFFGMTPREIYIAMSEEFLKKVAGPAALGYIARKQMTRMQGARIFVFSDAGFAPEWEPIIDYVGEENFMLVEIHSAQKGDFSNDSRGYIGDELKVAHPRMKLVKLNNVIGDAQDKELFRVLAQGAAINFLRHEMKDEE